MKLFYEIVCNALVLIFNESGSIWVKTIEQMNRVNGHLVGSPCARRTSQGEVAIVVDVSLQVKASSYRSVSINTDLQQRRIILDNQLE
jgi:hypothetical protein